MACEIAKWNAPILEGAPNVSILRKEVFDMFYPILKGVAGFIPPIFPFCAPPIPVLNDQSQSFTECKPHSKLNETDIWGELLEF